MLKPEPVTLHAGNVHLVPMTADHAAGIDAAAADGELWNLRITSVPAPGETPPAEPPPPPVGAPSGTPTFSPDSKRLFVPLLPTKAEAAG